MTSRAISSGLSRATATAQRRPRGAVAAFRLLGALFSGGLLVGCSDCFPQWGSRIEVEVFVARPGEWWGRFGDLDHLIVVPSTSPGGTPTESVVTRGRASIRLKIDKRANLPILDYPLLGGRCDLLKPAGAIFPLDLEEHGRISMSYREGFLSELLAPVCEAGDLLGALNVRRLRKEVWERSSGDPWRLDREAILQGLLYGVMRSDRIRIRPSFTLVLNAAAGTWVCGDPFYGPVAVDPVAPMLVLEGLPEGAHRLFRIDSAGVSERIDVQVSETGWVWMDEATGYGESGRW